MLKTMAIILIGLAIVGIVIYVYKPHDIKYCDSIALEYGHSNEAQCYQGPVRPLDDEEYFRRTGKTIPLEVKK